MLMAMSILYTFQENTQVHSINSIGKTSSIIIGDFEFPLPTVKKKYDILIVGDVHIHVEVTMRLGMSLLTRLEQPC